ncbi:MAG TPA: Rieske 2Fe-2S domain-containing protein [Blastocatellia bacterium]|nr:Rieske 2Fe-2S domain-containing protein [Blastocatellia bacterium]
MIECDKPIDLRRTKRRSFLGLIAGAIASGISAVLGLTIARYSVAPAFSVQTAERWIDLGPLEEIPSGKLVKRSLLISQPAGWGEFVSKKSVWVVRTDGDLRIFSAVCPHLGCTVNTSHEQFVCACHGSAWDLAGQRLGGPTPRQLDQLEHRVEDQRLKVKYQDFKQGIAAKELAG